MFSTKRQTTNNQTEATSWLELVSPSSNRAGDEAPFTFVAEFFTVHRVVRAELSSAERRLSDHLNSSLPRTDIHPLSADGNHGPIDLSAGFGQLTKAHVLLVVPLEEPVRSPGLAQTPWKPMLQRQCWVGIGPYTISGTIHTEVGYAPSVALRMLDKQFLPLTHATLRRPDGTEHTHDIVIVNRYYADVLVLEDASD